LIKKSDEHLLLEKFLRSELLLIEQSLDNICFLFNEFLTTANNYQHSFKDSKKAFQIPEVIHTRPDNRRSKRQLNLLREQVTKIVHVLYLIVVVFILNKVEGQ
jgi:hypothetical protein